MNNDEIKRMYLDGMSATSIAKHFNTTTSTITNRLKKMDIEVRTHIVPMPPREDLYDLYINQVIAAREIAKRYNTNVNTVMGWLRKYDIEIRTGAARNATKASQNAVPSTSIQIANPVAYSKISDRKWLRDQYVSRGIHIRKIGRSIGVSENLVLRYIRKYNLDELQYRYKRFVLYILAMKYIKDPYARLINLSKTKSWIDPTELSKKIIELGGEMRKTSDYDDIKFSNISRGEQELFDWVHSIAPDAIQGFKMAGVTRGEIDIYIPSIQFGIEYNGLFYHNESNNFNRLTHLDKLNVARSQNISLMYVWEDDWKYKKDIVKSQIRHKLKMSKSIYARKCNVVYNVSAAERRIFLDTNHIQGFTNSSISYGLELDGTLVALMTFTIDQNGHFTINRFCNILNHHVIGGFSKLLKQFERDNPTREIRSQSHNDWYDGSMYKNNGFELLRVNPPSYWYLNNARVKNGGGKGVREHRSAYTKDAIIRKFELDPGMKSLYTEDQLVDYVNDNYGRKVDVLVKIWNCGTTTWVKNKGAEAPL